MSELARYCHDCEQELTDENTTDFGGFDGSNFLSSMTFGQMSYVDEFTKCDGCFEGDIDRALEKMYE